MNEKSTIQRTRRVFENQRKEYRIVAEYVDGAKSRIEKSSDSSYVRLFRGILVGTGFTISALNRDNDILEEMAVANLLTERWLRRFRGAVVKDLERIASEVQHVKGQGPELKKTKRKVERLKEKMSKQNRKFRDVLTFLNQATENAKSAAKNSAKNLKKRRVELRKELSYIG
jgi:hypothetical protein